MQKIEDAVCGVLEAMRQRGIGDYSISCINWSVYRPIVNWHYEHGTEFCSDELLESLCERQRVRYEGGEICRKFYRSFVTASFRIHSYVTTGEVDFSIVKDARRYRPNESYQELTEAILQSTDLTDGHKKRLSVPIRHFFCFMQGRNKGSAQIGDRDSICKHLANGLIASLSAIRSSSDSRSQGRALIAKETLRQVNELSNAVKEWERDRYNEVSGL